MKKTLLLLTCIILMGLSKCEENPTEPNEVETIGTIEIVLLNGHNPYIDYYPEELVLGKTEFIIKKEKVLNMHRILHHTLEIDTSIYFPFVSINNIDSGGVLLIDNYYESNDSWYNPLSKRRVNISKTKSGNRIPAAELYYFTTIRNLHQRDHAILHLWYYRKDGTAEKKGFHIDKHDRYYISPEDASMHFNNRDIFTKTNAKADSIRFLDFNIQLESEELYNQYLVVQVNKLYDDSEWRWRAFKTDAMITTNLKQSFGYRIGGKLHNFDNYTFIFEKE